MTALLEKILILIRDKIKGALILSIDGKYSFADNFIQFTFHLNLIRTIHALIIVIKDMHIRFYLNIGNYSNINLISFRVTKTYFKTKSLCTIDNLCCWFSMEIIGVLECCLVDSLAN